MYVKVKLTEFLLSMNNYLSVFIIFCTCVLIKYSDCYICYYMI